MESTKMLKVEAIKSPKSGEAVRNQFAVRDNGKVYFQSYQSIIAIWDGETLTLGRDWDYSITTMKWLYEFLSQYCWSIYSHLQCVYGCCNAKAIRKELDKGSVRIAYNGELR